MDHRRCRRLPAVLVSLALVLGSCGALGAAAAAGGPRWADPPAVAKELPATAGHATRPPPRAEAQPNEPRQSGQAPAVLAGVLLVGRPFGSLRAARRVLSGLPLAGSPARGGRAPPVPRRTSPA